MKSYLILNRVTKDQVWTSAESFQEACENLGFMPADCHVMREIEIKKEKSKSDTYKVVAVPPSDSWYVKRIEVNKGNCVAVTFENPYSREKRLDLLRDYAKKARRNSKGRFISGYEKLIF